MTSPSRDWQEILTADEDQRLAQYAEILSEIQRKKSEAFGPGRALHRKQLIGLEAELEILRDLPLYAKHGLFAKSGRFQALVRLSNGSTALQSDRQPDIRGFAIKVLGVSGPSALGGTTDAQDFLLINREVFGLKNSEAFVKLVLAASEGGASMFKHFTKEYGFIRGIKQLLLAAQSIKRAFTGFATERFYSAAPIACGPFAVRVRLLPPESQTVNTQASEDWALDIEKRLAHGPLRYALQLQFFQSEAKTPIEDGSVNWEEYDSPYTTVGYLTLHAAPEGSREVLQKAIDAAAFDPWCALADHRPLGEIMRARKHAYYASQKNRRSGKV